jgi:hypothetical protein
MLVAEISGAERHRDKQEREQRGAGSAKQQIEFMPGVQRFHNDYPRPTNGILLAITVMNRTLVSRGRLAI